MVEEGNFCQKTPRASLLEQVIAYHKPSPNTILDGADDTQDPEEDEQQVGRVKDWINCYHLDTVELTHVLSNFPDISLVKAFSFTCFFWS